MTNKCILIFQQINSLRLCYLRKLVLACYFNSKQYRNQRYEKKLPIQDLQNSLEKLIEEAAQIPETQEA